MKLLLKTILCLCFTFNGFAELTFVEKKVTVKTELGQKIVKVIFEAKNDTSDDISIAAAKVTCDCMWMTSKFPLVVNAGKTVKLEAEYDTSGKLGINRGRVLLDIKGKTDTLLVELDIPTAVTVSPRFLIWKKGSRESKNVTVTMHPDWKGSIDEAVSKDDKVLTKISGKFPKLDVSVTPDKSIGKKRTWVILKGKDPEGKTVENRVYLIFN